MDSWTCNLSDLEANIANSPVAVIQIDVHSYADYYSAIQPVSEKSYSPGFSIGSICLHGIPVIEDESVAPGTAAIIV